MKTLFNSSALLICFILLSACSSTPIKQADELPAERTAETTLTNGTTHALDVYDPWEGFNRGVYRFNAGFDHYVFLPVVRGYSVITPDVVEDGISNFFNNIFEIKTLINTILQLKPKESVDTAGRFVINSTVGLLGIFDVATRWGIQEHDEDFGQTLGHYGVGNGPYLVLPIIGPSNLRDTAGIGVDALAFSEIDLLNLDDHGKREVAFYLMDAINTRHRMPFRYYDSGSPFEYELIRMLYTSKRKIEINR